MADNDGAGAGHEDGQAGSGAPAGGSPEGGSEKDALEDKFERRIKSALASQKQHHDRELAAVNAKFDAYVAGAGGKKEEPVEAPKRYTRAELKAAVTANQITEEQSEEMWAKQVKDEARAEAIQAADEHVTRRTAKERIDSDLTTYKRLAPEIMDEGSETRQRIREEFKNLADTGMPARGSQALATELAAIRAVMGPLEKLEKARGARRHVESDEQSGGGGEGKKTGKKLVDQLSARQKEHYQKGIGAGRYKDWAAVEAELAFSPSRVGRA